DVAEALVAPGSVEGGHGLPEAGGRPTIVALGMVSEAEALVGERLQDGLPAGRGERESTLGRGDGLVIRAHKVAMDGEIDRDLAQPTRVVEGHREGFGLAQISHSTPKVTKRSERRAQGEPEIDGLLTCVALLWQMREGTERLLEGPHSLAVGRPCHRLLPRLAA